MKAEDINNENINRHKTDVKNSFEDLQKAIDRLNKYVETLILGSGRKFEKAMIELYKEDLELHGVNPEKIKHRVVVDEKGVTPLKGFEYEVNFYEANDKEVYLFKFLIEGDSDSVIQLLNRKRLFESMGKKVTKMFLVCHVISKKDKELAEKNGITVITDQVIRKSK